MEREQNQTTDDMLREVLASLDTVKQDVANVKQDVDGVEQKLNGVQNGLAAVTRDLDNSYSLVQAVQRQVNNQANEFVRKKDLAKLGS